MAIDYQSVLANALRDEAGNGFRAESTARFAMALLFAEAIRAREECRIKGFLLQVSTTAEAFTLSTSPYNPPVGPQLVFVRAGDVISITPSGFFWVGADAPKAHVFRAGETTSETTADSIRDEADAHIALAVDALARQFKAGQQRGTK